MDELSELARLFLEGERLLLQGHAVMVDAFSQLMAYQHRPTTLRGTLSTPVRKPEET